MKKLVAFPFVWFAYGFGSMACWILELKKSENWVGFWYPFYNQAMITSSDVQDWAEGDGAWWPWGPYNNK